MQYIIIVLSITLLIIGCEDEQGPANPQLSGNIEGWVTLYDDLGHPIQDESGVSVTLDKTELSSHTLTDGYWEFKNVPAGIYDFFFRKDNFFTVKFRNIQFVGGGTYYLGEISIRRIPSIFVTELEATSDKSGPNINFEITTSYPDTVSRRIHVLFSLNPINSSGFIDYILSSETLLPANLVYTASSKNINDEQYALFGLEKGKPLYMVAYVLPIFEDSFSDSHYNPATKQYEFYCDNVTLSNVVIVSVP
jgi:hypothetical protein